MKYWMKCRIMHIYIKMVGFIEDVTGNVLCYNVQYST